MLTKTIFSEFYWLVIRSQEGSSVLWKTTRRESLLCETDHDDLFKLVKDYADWQSKDGVHFNVKGNEALAKQVAESISQQLRLVE